MEIIYSIIISITFSLISTLKDWYSLKEESKRYPFSFSAYFNLVSSIALKKKLTIDESNKLMKFMYGFKAFVYFAVSLPASLLLVYLGGL